MPIVQIESILVQNDAWMIALSLAGAMLACWAAGWFIGKRLRRSGVKEDKFSFDDASLALLGLLLAFTFSLSLSKYEQRRTMVISDSTAIGDFYTCASLLKEPVRTKLRDLIRSYAELRLQMARNWQNREFIENGFRQIPQMHDQMVDLVAQELATGTPIAVSLTNTLNAVTTNHAARMAAIEDRLPAPVVILLFISAVLAALLVGREQGEAGVPQVMGTLAFILITCLAIYVTLDLNQPQRGLITVSQRPIERLLSSMPK
jgi:hypothetical protein